MSGQRESTSSLGRLTMKPASRSAFFERSSVWRLSSALRSLGLTSEMQFSLALISESSMTGAYLDVGRQEPEALELVAVHADAHQAPELVEAANRGQLVVREVQTLEVRELGRLEGDQPVEAEVQTLEVQQPRKRSGVRKPVSAQVEDPEARGEARHGSQVVARDIQCQQARLQQRLEGLQVGQLQVGPGDVGGPGRSLFLGLGLFESFSHSCDLLQNSRVLKTGRQQEPAEPAQAWTEERGRDVVRGFGASG